VNREGTVAWKAAMPLAICTHRAGAGPWRETGSQDVWPGTGISEGGSPSSLSCSARAILVFFSFSVGEQTESIATRVPSQLGCETTSSCSRQCLSVD